MIAKGEHKGKPFELDIPFSAHEMKYADVIDFRAHEQASFKANGEGKELDALISLNSAVLSLVSGDLQYVPNYLDQEDAKTLIDNGYTIQPGEDVSMARLYAHLVSTVNNYEPEELKSDFSLDWYDLENDPCVRGQEKKFSVTYYIDPERADRLLTEKAYTNGETIELLEFRKDIKANIEEKGDPQGNLAFTLSLAQMSILLRKKGEELPAQAQERKAFIDHRSKVFADLPYNIVLDVRFFLIGILIKSSQIQDTAYS